MAAQSTTRPVITQETARVLLVALETGLKSAPLDEKEIRLVLRFMNKIAEFDQTATIFERIVGEPYDANELLIANRTGRIDDVELDEDELYQMAAEYKTKEVFKEIGDYGLEALLHDEKIEAHMKQQMKAELIRRERDDDHVD